MILKMLHISPPNGKVAAIRQVQSPTALFANVGKIYEKAVVAAAKIFCRKRFLRLAQRTGQNLLAVDRVENKNFSPCVI